MTSMTVSRWSVRRPLDHPGIQGDGFAVGADEGAAGATCARILAERPPRNVSRDPRRARARAQCPRRALGCGAAVRRSGSDRDPLDGADS